MLRTVLRSTLCVLLLLVQSGTGTSQSSTSAAALTINEEKSRMEIVKNDLRLALMIENASKERQSGQLELEFLRPNDEVIWNAKESFTIAPGAQPVRIEERGFLKATIDSGEIKHFRLRYRLTSKSGTARQGTIGFPSLLPPEKFVLKIAVDDRQAPSDHWHLSVLALHPETFRGVPDVTVTSKLTIQESGTRDKTIEATGRTAPNGDARLRFAIPGFQSAKLLIDVTGRLGSEIHSVSNVLATRNSADAPREAVIHVMTDKPLYQPGQALRIRTLAFGRDSKALAGKPIVIEVRNPDYSEVFRRTLITSKFGETDTEWLLPASADLGLYSVEGRIDDTENLASVEGKVEVRVDRYDLPAFTVRATPDRGYYEKGQNPIVAIDASYFFGQPLPKGHVTIVHNLPRVAFRPDRESRIVAEGDTDTDGHFAAKIDLWDETVITYSYQRYADADFTAYVTDTVSGRTSYRQFTLRRTQQPLHVYLKTVQPVALGLPIEIVVATAYADGTPAQCDVSIYESSESSPVTHTLLAKISTSRLGTARLNATNWTPHGTFANSLLVIPRNDRDFDPGPPLSLIQSVAPVRYLRLHVEASDTVGNKGSAEDQVYYETAAIQIYPDKTIYAAGDPVRLQLRSTQKAGPVMVALSSSGAASESCVIQLVDGTGTAEFQKTGAFRGRVEIVATYVGGNIGNPRLTGTYAVAFPNAEAFAMDLTSTKGLYAPGAEATLQFRVRNAGGDGKGNQEALLGIRIVDSAVNERVGRNDNSSSKGADPQADIGERVAAELNRTDRTQPIPAELAIAADYLLNNSEKERTAAATVWGENGNPFGHWSNALRDALEKRLLKDRMLPAYDPSVRAVLGDAGFADSAMDDPWGSPVRFYFYLDGAWEWLTAWTIGPDKKAGTADDFNLFSVRWPYFEKRAELLTHAVSLERARSGTFVRDIDTLRHALGRIGEDLDSWKDPQGNPLRYDFFTDAIYSIRVTGSGHDGRFGEAGQGDADDAVLYRLGQDSSPRIRFNLQEAVNRHFRTTSIFPETRTQFEEAMRAGNAPKESLVDPWGHRLYPRLEQRPEAYRADLIVASWSEVSYAENQWRTETLAGARLNLPFLTVYSAGPDGIEGNKDDFPVANLAKVLAELSLKEPLSTPPDTEPPATGNLQGAVVDSSRRWAISNLQITLLGPNGFQATATTGSGGAYALENVPAGLYDVLLEGRNSEPQIVRGVPIRSGVTTLNMAFEAPVLPLYGNDPLVLITTLPGYRASPMRFEDVRTVQPDENGWFKDGSAEQQPLRAPARTSASAQAYTPRVRSSFAETAYWQPALVTNRNGEAEVRFRLPDNLTTWRVDAVASTVDGKIAVDSTQFLSYLPFFLESDPPRILTVGDEIALPTPIRSYLDKDQTVKVAMKPDSWFQISGPAERSAAVKSGEAHTEIFRFKAIAPIENGTQRVTATGTAASDAIEKPISVRPSGQEHVETTTRILRGQSAGFDLDLPATVPLNTVRSELRIYPDVASQLSDAVEGIFKRPAGCAEQTISSSYPSLLMLRLAKQGDPRVAKHKDIAQEYLKAGYKQLLEFQSREGGFGYWVGSESDIAVTAFALLFFNDADTFIDVDNTVVSRAKDWLHKQQRADGSWHSNRTQDPADATNAADVARRVLALTGYVTRILTAMGEPAEQSLRYLEEHASSSNDAYALATLALAAEKTGRHDLARRTADKLERISRSEKDRTYWEAETPTPFYGWGLPGNLETTALAIRALAAVKPVAGVTTRAKTMDQGLTFLLQSRDRYGVWHSTQATALVLDTLIAQLGGNAGARATGRIDILVNGAVASTADIEANGGGALSIDIGQFLRTGANRIEVRTKRGTPTATIQLIETHYSPWPETMPDTTNGLSLRVRFDKTDLTLGDTVTCTVDAERVSSNGNGMLLAEIGLPPGAEVDRESLEAMLHTAGAGLSRYEIQPDRVVAYLWPSYRKSAMHLEFKFRPRYGLDAQTGPSALYDYYNPDARVVARPIHFKVHQFPLPVRGSSAGNP